MGLTFSLIKFSNEVSMSSIAALKDAINEVRFNPAAIQRKVFETLEEITSGRIDIVDPSNPFVFLLEASAVTASAVMVEAETLTRRLYPSMALTEDELYLHMSDRDYLGRFSSPSRTSFTVLLNKVEVIKRAVATEVIGISKLVIPRNTEFMVSNYTFTMEYPIEIRVLAHGGIQVVYDGTVSSPIQTLESNLVDWSTVKMDDQEYLRIQIPVQQFKIDSEYAHLTLSSSYQKSFTYEDYYYACRIFRLVNGLWEEIAITHTDQVFDPNYPTALLKVFTNLLKITIPQVYISNKKLDSELRIDIYTTKGPLDIILDGYNINAFSANWRDIALGLTAYSAPLTSFSSMAVFSDSVVTGGSEPLTFEVLRERVIQNAIGNSQIPITNMQITTRLANYGYQAIASVDNVTNRIYLASRHLPPPNDTRLITPAGCTVNLFQSTFANLVQFAAVMDNGPRITLTSALTYERINGVVRLITDYELEQLGLLTVDEFIAIVNTRQILYSPFHTVLDNTKNYFTTRSYHLDNPAIKAREFIEENTSLDMGLSTGLIKVLKTESGYTLRVVTSSGDVVKGLANEQLLVQLSYRPPNEKLDVYLNGVLTNYYGDERVYEFYLNSSFDLDALHYLYFSNFMMYSGEVKSFTSSLDQAFNLVYYVKDYEPPNSIVLDLHYNGADFLIPKGFTGVMHELVKIHFGDYLEGFWENSRSIIESIQYRTYSDDILAFYPKHVYQRNPLTGAIDVSINKEGKVEFTIIHRAGDPVLDSEGNQAFSHRAGDPLLDDLGNPIPLNSRGILQEVDHFLIDGRYRYATQDTERKYLKAIPLTLVDWLKTDIKLFQQWALEQTQIYFYPLITMGSAKVAILEGEFATIDLEQSLSFTFYLSRSVYDNGYIRQVLADSATNLINEVFKEKRIAANEIVSKLTELAGDNMIAVDFSGLGGKLNLSVMTLLNDNQRCAVKKRLERNDNGTIRIVNDIAFNYIKYEN